MGQAEGTDDILACHRLSRGSHVSFGFGRVYQAVKGCVVSEQCIYAMLGEKSGIGWREQVSSSVLEEKGGAHCLRTCSIGTQSSLTRGGGQGQTCSQWADFRACGWSKEWSLTSNISKRQGEPQSFRHIAVSRSRLCLADRIHFHDHRCYLQKASQPNPELENYFERGGENTQDEEEFLAGVGRALT